MYNEPNMICQMIKKMKEDGVLSADEVKLFEERNNCQVK